MYCTASRPLYGQSKVHKVSFIYAAKIHIFTARRCFWFFAVPQQLSEEVIFGIALWISMAECLYIPSRPLLSHWQRCHVEATFLMLFWTIKLDTPVRFAAKRS